MTAWPGLHVPVAMAAVALASSTRAARAARAGVSQGQTQSVIKLPKTTKPLTDQMD